jgi:CheY-like chemotaxis protein
MDLIEERHPDVVLLDVALPTMYGFEICERIRNTPALSGVKTILIASIYDKTRYKREPQSLYGADDYIEKHHILRSRRYLMDQIQHIFAFAQRLPYRFCLFFGDRQVADAVAIRRGLRLRQRLCSQKMFELGVEVCSVLFRGRQWRFQSL